MGKNLVLLIASQATVAIPIGSIQSYSGKKDWSALINFNQAIETRHIGSEARVTTSFVYPIIEKRIATVIYSNFCIRCIMALTKIFTTARFLRLLIY